MGKGYTKQILAEINRAKVGEIFTLHDFPEIPPATASTILNRISKNKEYLLRVKKGVFSKIEKTRFGIAKATPLEIICSEINNDENKCFGGLFLFNQLGLTTQIPTTIEILNNKSSYSTKIGETNVRYVKIRQKITTKTKKYIALLEVIKKVQQIPDGKLKLTNKWLQQKLENSSTLELEKLTEIALDYQPKVRVILGNLLQGYSKSLSDTLKLSINQNSYFHVGSFIKYLTDTKEWRIKS